MTISNEDAAVATLPDEAPFMEERVVGGVRVRYLEMGAGPPLLLVHGFLVSHREWRPLLPDLSKHFRCIAVDLPGFGQSDRPNPDVYDYRRETYVDTLVALLDDLGIDDFHVAGHSMGGGIALMLAARHAHRVTRLSLLSPMCLPFPLTLSGKLALIPVLGPAAFRLLYRRGIFRHYFLRDVYNGRQLVPEFVIDGYYHGFTTSEGRLAAYACLRQSLRFESVQAALPKVTMPTRVLWGGEDRVIALSTSVGLMKALPSASLQVFSGGCHAFHEQFPDQVTEEILRHHLAGVVGAQKSA